MNPRGLLLFLYFVVFKLPVIGQWNQLKFRQLGANDGLSGSLVQCIYEDNQGFMWFGTREGLCKYDGYKFTIFKRSPNNKNTITWNNIMAVQQDRNKLLWIATTEGGVNVLDLYKDQFQQVNDLLPPGKEISKYLLCLFRDRNENIWIGSSESYLYVVNPSTGLYRQYNFGSSVSVITEDFSGNIWIGTVNNGIIVLDKKGNPTRSFSRKQGNSAGLTDDHIKFLFEDSKKTMWVGTYGGGLNQFDRKAGNFREINLENNRSSSVHKFLLCIEEDKTGNLWIGTENAGLQIYNPGSGTTTPYLHYDNDNTSIGSNTINCISRDSKGNMWIGTSNAGISMVSIDEVRFTHYRNFTNKNSLSNNIVNTIYEDQAHRIWIGTDGGGLNLFNPATGSFSSFRHKPGNKSSICGNYVLSIAEDSERNLWLGTWGDGITVFNYETNRYNHFRHDPSDPGSLSSNYAFTIFRDSRNRIWVGTYGEGLNLYDGKSGKFIRFRNDSRPRNYISSNHILSIQEDRIGNLWIGTDGGGLNKFNETDQSFNAFTTTSDSYAKGSEKLSNNSVTSIWEDGKGHLWIGTNSGLNCFDPVKRQNKTYFSENGLANDAIGAVLGDRDGNLWISTNKGISKLTIQTGHFENFTTADGLQADEFKYAKCMDHEGRIYFGGRNGFNVFSPDKITAIPYDPPLYFTNFQLFNKDVRVARDKEDPSPLKSVISMTDKIVLSHKQSSFSFEFASLNYTDAGKKQYSYKLEGYDDEWQNLGTRNSLTYTNLDPGNYTLKVKGLKNDQEWSEKATQVELIITPPFWNTWAFKISMVLLLAGFISAFFHYRINSVKKRNRQLEKKVELRTKQLSETNVYLLESNEKINQQKEHLENVNKEIVRKTDRILQQQEQILTQNQQLETTVSKLEASNNTKDRFFSILAHDLKNPIAAINGLADLLKSRLPNLNQEEISNYINNISKSSGSVHNLVMNLLDWARTQSDSLYYKPDDLNIHELVLKNIFLAQAQMTNKNIQCRVDIENTHTIYADYQMINTVIRNILSNSIKFTPASGSIIIKSEARENEIAIIISDTGVGMLPQMIDNLKNASSQGSIGTAGETGTGLGLQISMDFIRVNNGSLDIESTPGKGSVFTIRLPKSLRIVNPPEAVLTRQKETTEEWSQGEQLANIPETEYQLPELQRKVLKGKRILIVDDNPDVRNYLKILLSSVFEIDEATNGQDGLKIAISSQPDLIISDLIMPVMNGIEFCQQVKTNILTSHIPLLMLTGETTEKSQVSGYEAGADIYLTKPVNSQIIFNVIYNRIKNQEKIRNKFIVTEQLIPDEVDFNKSDKEFLEKMSLFIEENLDQTDLDYKKLSEHAAMSRTVLYSKFKTLTGMGVHDFIKNLRLKKALKLLQEGRMNITQIAYEVGFATPSYFSKSFAKQYKLSPKEYVLTLKSNAEKINNSTNNN